MNKNSDKTYFKIKDSDRHTEITMSIPNNRCGFSCDIKGVIQNQEFKASVVFEELTKGKILHMLSKAREMLDINFLILLAFIADSVTVFPYIKEIF